MKREERGAIAVITAIAMTMIMGATALSFDIGREVDTNRFVQATADAVALDAANFVDGSPAASIDSYTPIGGSQYELAQIIQYEAAQSAIRNNVSTADLPGDSVTLGSCSTTSPCAFVPVESCPLTETLPVPDSGSPGACSLVTGADPTTAINAVQVSASSVTSFVFQAGSATSVRTATAMRSFANSTQAHPKMPTSAFSLGSTLLDFNNPLVDQVLSQELGTSAANISALSYSGLVGATVSLGDIVAANASVGTLYNLLNTSASPATLLGYYYNALLAQHTPAAGAAATNLNMALGVTGSGSSQISGGANATVKLCQLVDLSGQQSSCGVSGSALDPAAYAQVDAVSFLTGVASLSGQGHAVGINIGIAQLLNATVTLVTPMVTVGPGPADDPCPSGYSDCPLTAGNQQGSVNLTIANVSLGSLLPLLDVSLTAGAADANATLSGLSCGISSADPATTATLSGTTTAATLSGSLTVAGTTAPLASASVAASTFTHTFDGPFGSGQPAPWESTNTMATVVLQPPPSSLLGSLFSPVTSILNTVLAPALGPVLSALGVNLGYATLIDNYVNCDNATLVATTP